MKSEIVKVNLSDGNIQNYQLISGFDWDDLLFKSPNFNLKSVKALAHLYEVNIIPKNPAIYGFMVFYNIDGLKIDLDRNTEIGYIFDDQVLLNYYFDQANKNNQVKLNDEVLTFEDSKLQSYYNQLLKLGNVYFAKGLDSFIDFIPVSKDMGYLSELENYKLKVNSHFFLMDRTDLDSLYGSLGTPHGLALENSKVILPPLNHRECLLVDYNNKVYIKNLIIDDFKVSIDNQAFINDRNAIFYSRPNTRTTPKCEGSSIIIVKNKVVAIKDNGEVEVPMAGFVIQTNYKVCINNTDVEYLGDFSNYKLGIQVGPAMVVNNNQVKSLVSPFYKGEGVPFPSTVYPLDFDKGRAARIGLGQYKGSPIIIWAEGAGKLGYKKGLESCGASLLEFSTFCKSYGIDNLVNLDGGGSAQIIYEGKKYLKIADRKIDKVTEAERPIPFALVLN